MGADWQIIPRCGIGRLTFGLSAEEVSAMAAIYGEPSPFCSHADTASHLEVVIAQYGSTLSAEDIATMRRDAQGAILLDYRDSRRESVAVEAHHLQAHYDGRLVFTLGAKEVLVLFE